jgi:phage FluMu protein Com
MPFTRKYYEKEIKCPHCHEVNKPIIQKNRLGTSIGLYGRVGVDNASIHRKYLLVCPHCKYIIGSL